MDDLLRRVFDGVATCCVEVLPGLRVVDFDYADYVALLVDDPQVFQADLNNLAGEVTLYGTHFALFQCKAVFQFVSLLAGMSGTRSHYASLRFL